MSSLTDGKNANIPPIHVMKSRISNNVQDAHELDEDILEDSEFKLVHEIYNEHRKEVEGNEPGDLENRESVLWAV